VVSLCAKSWREQVQQKSAVEGYKPIHAAKQGQGRFTISPGGFAVPVVLDLNGDIVPGPGTPEIMIRCPMLGTAVRTGLRTERIIFDSIIEGLEIPLRCPA
jgi:hypothetical protein